MKIHAKLLSLISCAGNALPIKRTRGKQQTHHTIAFHSNHRARASYLRRSPSFLCALAKRKRNHLLCLHSSVSSMCTLAVCLLILFILHSARLENILLFCRAIIISLSWIWEMWNVCVQVVGIFIVGTVQAQASIWFYDFFFIHESLENCTKNYARTSCLH